MTNSKHSQQWFSLRYMPGCGRLKPNAVFPFYGIKLALMTDLPPAGCCFCILGCLDRH
jgi:hypothetical protein